MYGLLKTSNNELKLMEQLRRQFKKKIKGEKYIKKY